MIFPVFPRSTHEEERLFDLLKKAYIDARYKREYKITKKEFEYLAGRVRKLHETLEIDLQREDRELCVVAAMVLVLTCTVHLQELLWTEGQNA